MDGPPCASSGHMVSSSFSSVVAQPPLWPHTPELLRSVVGRLISGALAVGMAENISPAGLMKKTADVFHLKRPYFERWLRCQ
jgi:hypothetical protein